jgi:hypothetical protein
VKVDGVKNGKINEKEADKIVELVKESMLLRESESKPRTIGVISLMGDEQSRLIRGRLLDAVGPEKMARHDVLIGDPPTFQGAERDIVFLSMICSKGRAPTQSQLTHFQRANVAMSRARDRCVLVRSIDLTDIPSMDDMKVPIIEFFLNGSTPSDQRCRENEGSGLKRRKGSSILKSLLQQRGFSVTEMGVVWKYAICVEHPNAETRVALMVDCENESPQEWRSSYSQQKAIERVGWKCLRVDALSLLIDFHSVIECVIKVLASVGIEEPVTYNDTENHQVESQLEGGDVHGMEIEAQEREEGALNAPMNLENDDFERDAVTISSDEGIDDRKPAPAKPDRMSSSFNFGQEEDVNASRFGQVVDLDFLRDRPDTESDSDTEHQNYEANDEIRPTSNITEQVNNTGNYATRSERAKVPNHQSCEANDEIRPTSNITEQVNNTGNYATRSERAEVPNHLSCEANDEIRPTSNMTEQVNNTGNYATRSERAEVPNHRSYEANDEIRPTSNIAEQVNNTGNYADRSERAKLRNHRSYEANDETRPTSNITEQVNNTGNYATRSERANLPNHQSDSDLSSEEQSETGTSSLPSTRSKRSYKKLDKYSRDGRYYPKKDTAYGSDQEWAYDTDSDLPKRKEEDDDDDDDEVEVWVEPNGRQTEEALKDSPCNSPCAEGPQGEA